METKTLPAGTTEYKRNYFQNAIFCGECTGSGCKQCNGTGIESLNDFLGYRKGDPIALRAEYNACFIEEMSNRKNV